MEIRNFRKLFLCRLNEDPLTPQESENIKAKKTEGEKREKHEEGVVKSHNRSQVFVLLCYLFWNFCKNKQPPNEGKNGLKSEVGEFSHFPSFFKGILRHNVGKFKVKVIFSSEWQYI